MTAETGHDGLTILAQRRFDRFEPYELVTFLNQSLKARGLIFGVRLVDGRYELVIYDAVSPRSAE
jgi:hypothetical protein